MAGPKLVVGGTPIISTAQELQRGQIPANTTLQQPAATAFSLVDQFQKNSPGPLQVEVQEISGQVNTHTGQITTLQNQVAALQAQVAILQRFMDSFQWTGAEQLTGLIHNGSNVYTRSFYWGSGFSQPNSVTQIPHGIPGFNYLVAHWTVDWAGGGGYSFAITYLNAASTNNAQDSVSFYIDPTFINSTSGETNRSNDIVMMTLWYTCTDR